MKCATSFDFRWSRISSFLRNTAGLIIIGILSFVFVFLLGWLIFDVVDVDDTITPEIGEDEILQVVVESEECD